MTIARSWRITSVAAQSDVLRGLVTIILFLLAWQATAEAPQWLGITVPGLSRVPPPTSVLKVWGTLLLNPGYWQSWYLSATRVLFGFAVAMVVGIPFGLWMAVSRTAREIAFPSLEVLRPIPPLAWIPASIIFWPTQELSIGFIIFLGAFFTIIINVLDGARAIDARYFEAARSMGASRWYMFRRIVLPGTLPSIVTGATVGMGITWEVVVAAEMISGGGSSMGHGGSGGGAGGGLGFFIWNSYIGGSYDQIIVGMLSIGIAGYFCSEAIRRLGHRMTPWLSTR